jgi:hypothetical protein
MGKLSQEAVCADVTRGMSRAAASLLPYLHEV